MRPSHYSPVETALHLADELAEAASVRKTRPGHLHSAIAGRALFGAIKADLTAFGRHLGLLLARWWRSKLFQGGKRTRTRAEGRAPRRTPVVVPFIKGIAMAALLGGLLLTGGILWALQERPGAPAQSNRPSLVLETADGRALGAPARSLARQLEATSRRARQRGAKHRGPSNSTGTSGSTRRASCARRA